MQGNWKIAAVSNPATVVQTISIYREMQNGDIQLVTDFSRGVVETISRESFMGEEMSDKYTAKFMHEYLEEIVTAFVEFARKRGFKNSEESFTKGKMEATEKHLEDMRTLIFQPQILEKKREE